MPEELGGPRPVELSTTATAADRVRTAAFALLLGSPRAIEATEISTVSGVDDVAATLDALAAAGWVDRDSQGRVTGAAGLSLDHGPHALVLGGHRYRTWCAFDTLGIAGALNADASVETRCGWCGSEIALAIRSGRAEGAEAERLWLAAGGTDLRTQFCEPTVLLCSADHADRWSAAHDGHGTVLTLEAAAQRGEIEWEACATTAINLGFWDGPPQ